MKLKILFVSANPIRDLLVDEEYREIENAIKKSDYNTHIELIPKLACRMEDLIVALHTEKPDILHFSGHGVGEDGLLFANPDSLNTISINEGQENEEHIGIDFVPARALENIFEGVAENLKLVVLNACLSDVQAKSIVKHIDFVVGMNSSVYDRTSIIFSKNFYAFFSSDMSIKTTFEQTKTTISVQAPDEKETPVLFSREGKEDIKIGDIITIEKEEEKEPTSQTNIHINGDITGTGVVTGGTVTQKINNKKINAKNNIEKIDNNDGGIINL